MAIEQICIIVGTRPQIIKSQPLINSLKSKFKLRIVNTGQHYDYDLSQKFFNELKISKPAINLNAQKGSQIQQISKIIRKLEVLFTKYRPDLVIIPGDTTSALAGCLAASKSKLKIAHLEAGARSNQFYMSEELNRRIVDHSSNFLFAPTKNCLKNLENESVFGKSYFVGDTMYDLFLEFKKLFSKSGENKSKNKILITIHRAENIEDKNRLKNIAKLIHELNKNEYEVVFPVHPHTQRKLEKFDFKISFVEKPIGYSDMLKNLFQCGLVITDSGGLQKEAYWMGRPCVTLRENTEWVETIKEKANFLYSPNKKISVREIEKILKLRVRPKKGLFGNGRASEKISGLISKM